MVRGGPEGSACTGVSASGTPSPLRWCREGGTGSVYTVLSLGKVLCNELSGTCDGVFGWKDIGYHDGERHPEFFTMFALYLTVETEGASCLIAICVRKEGIPLILLLWIT